MRLSTFFLLLVVAMLSVPASGQSLVPPTAVSPMHGQGVFEGAFPGLLSYRLVTSDQGDRIDVIASNLSTRPVDVYLWIAAFDEPQTIREVGEYWAPAPTRRLEPEQTGVILQPLIPLSTTPWRFHRVAVWTAQLPKDSPRRTLVFSMVDPDRGRTLRWDSPEVAIAFSIIPQQIGFTLQNKTSGPIRIIWDESAFIDPAGRSHRVIHEGIRFNERDRPMSPTVVPPGARVDDLFYPASYVSWTGSRWLQQPLFTDDVRPPFTLGLFITLEVAGAKKGLNFRFMSAVDWPQQIKDLFSRP